MDTKLLLVKAITLVYLSTIVKELRVDLHSIVEQVLIIVKPAENSVRAELMQDPTQMLRELLINIYDESKNNNFNVEELKQRYMMVCGRDETIYNALVGGLLTIDDTEFENIRKRGEHERWYLKRELDKEGLGKVIRDLSIKIAYNPESVDWNNLVEDIEHQLSQFRGLSGISKNADDHPGIFSVVDFKDEEGVSHILAQAKDELSDAGILRSPYKGVNRMCGENGGFRRGECLLIGALRHNYKSGLSRDLFIGIPLANAPYMVDPDKTPLNLRVSLEDDPNTDIIEVYKRLRHHFDKTNDKVRDIDITGAAKYINDKLSVNGYENKIVSADPTNFGVDDIIRLIEAYERDGFEIHHLNIDYLAMSSKNATRSGADNSSYIQNMFTKLRNVCRKKKIFLSTPHQLGPEAKEKHKEGIADFVKQVAGKSFYDGCRKIDQEVDMEITIHLEKCNGQKYCTMQRGKHRGVNNTPEEDQYCAYLFDQMIGLPFDYDGEDKSYKSIGGSTVAEGGDTPLWDVTS